MQKTLGILGGMGPEATACFFRQVVKLTPAKTDQDHLQVIVLSNSQIPDRTAYLLHGGESPLPALISGVRDLERWGADFVVIPCNTVHSFWSRLCQAVRIPILSIVQETVQEIMRHENNRGAPGTSNIGLMATDATLRMELYQEALLAANLIPLIPTAEIQDKIQKSIYWIKGGQKKEQATDHLQEAILHLQERGASGLIYGCTELSLLADRLSARVPLFDSSTILAQAAVDFALRKEKKAPQQETPPPNQAPGPAGDSGWIPAISRSE